MSNVSLQWCRDAIEATWTQPYWIYYGGADKELDAFTVSRTRDSSVLEISNFDTICRDMEKRFPDHAWVERSSHFLVGWVDYLVVRMLHRSAFTEELRPSFAAEAIWKWEQALEDYPVADEMAYSEAEEDSRLKTLLWNFSCEDLDEAAMVLEYLYDNCSGSLENSAEEFWPDENEVDAALVEMSRRVWCNDCGELEQPDEVTRRRGVCCFCTYGYRLWSWFRAFQYRLQTESFLRQRKRFGITMWR